MRSSGFERSPSWKLNLIFCAAWMDKANEDVIPEGARKLLLFLALEKWHRRNLYTVENYSQRFESAMEKFLVIFADLKDGKV